MPSHIKVRKEKMGRNAGCTYIIKETANGSRLDSFAKIGNEEIGHASITLSDRTLTIVMWVVDKKFRNTGIGRELLRILIKMAYDKMGSLEKVLYDWNGVNPYVLEWMERNFNATCTEDIAVKKYDFSDNWDAHEYNLNPGLVLRYFGVR